MIKLSAKQLRDHRSSVVSFFKKKRLKKQQIYIILDNVLDTYNIGSIFRLADAVAAKKVYLCGGTATPPNSRIKKASINTTEWVEWKYFETATQAINDLRQTIPDIQIVAIEQSTKSTPFQNFEYKLPLVLIVGNETTGISEEVLNLCDGIVELPMYGVNISLNVMVSLGIVLYQALGNLGQN